MWLVKELSVGMGDKSDNLVSLCCVSEKQIKESRNPVICVLVFFFLIFAFLILSVSVWVCAGEAAFVC